MARLIALVSAVVFAVSLLAAPVAFAQAAAKDKPAATKPAKKEPIDINSASAEELQTLKGIGEAYSKKIIEGRPYKGKDELVQKNIIPKATYDKIKGQIIAKQK
jgi:competence protein ComEA